MKNGLFASVEAGGTKFVCAVGNADLEIVDKVEFPTTNPSKTIQITIDYFQQFKGQVKSLSVGSFGPINMLVDSPKYGYITTTPKEGWADTNLIGPLKESLEIPIFFTTDVNSAAYGEMKLRKKVHSLVYFTVGTGIGGGVILKGQEIGSIGHTELGHIFLSKHHKDVKFNGVCPFHNGCAEGLSSGPSILARYGLEGKQISEEHEIWDILAYYYAQLAMNATLSYRPQVIVFGGGVFGQPHLIHRVRKQFESLLNNYVETPPLKEYIVTPLAPNNTSATIGNFVIAKELCKKV